MDRPKDVVQPKMVSDEHPAEASTAPGELTAAEIRDVLLESLEVPPSPFAEEPECQRLATAFEQVLDRSRHTAFPADLPGYDVLDCLGGGGMGDVYLARQRESGDLVAVKVLHADRGHSDSARRRFEQEFHAIAQLEHSAIVRARTICESQGLPVLVMDYVDGLSWAELLDESAICEQRLGIADACELVRQAAGGMQHAHDRGVVHRDLKPANLMLDRSGRVKILDLGIARILAPSLEADPMPAGLTVVGQLMGTLNYMAPEQARDSRQTDHRGDVYSLGATLYELLSGSPPFADDAYPTATSKIMAIGHVEPRDLLELRGDLPRELADLVQRALAKDPASRPQSMNQLAKLLEPFTAGHDLSALVADPASRFVLIPNVPRDRKPSHAGFGSSSRSQKTWPALAALLTTCIVGLALLYRNWPDPTPRGKLAQQPESTTLRSAVASAESSSAQALSPEATATTALMEAMPFTGLAVQPKPLPGLRQWQLVTRTPQRVPNLVSWSPSGSQFACMSDDGYLRVYTLRGTECSLKAIFPCRQGGFADNRALCWFDEERVALADGSNRNVEIWNLTEPQRGPLMLSHNAEETSVAWSAARQLIATSDHGGGVTIWNSAGQLLREIKIPATAALDIAWSPDGNRLAVVCANGRLRVLLVDEGQTAFDVQAHQGLANSVSWSAKGPWLATCGDDGLVSIWDDAGKLQKSLKTPWSDTKVKRITCVEWSTSGKYLATGGGDRLAVWNDSFQLLSSRLADPFTGIICQAIAWHPTSESVFTSAFGYSLKLWNPASGTHRTLIPARDSRIRHLSWHPQGTQVAVTTMEGSLLLFSSRGELLTSLSSFMGRGGIAAEWSPDGRRLAVAEVEQGKSVQILNAETLKTEDVITDHNSLMTAVWSSDGRWLLTGGWSENLIVWDAMRKIESSRAKFPHGVINDIAVAPRGARFALGNPEGHVVIGVISDEGVPVFQPESIRVGSTEVRDLAWHPEEDFLGIIDGQNIQVINLDGNIPLWTVPGWSLRSIAWPNGGQSLYCGSVGRIDLQSSTRTGDFDNYGSLATDPAGKRLIAGSYLHTLLLYDELGQTPQTFVVFPPDGRPVAMGLDGQLPSNLGDRADQFVYVFQQDDGSYGWLAVDQFTARYSTELGWK